MTERNRKTSKQNNQKIMTRVINQSSIKRWMGWNPIESLSSYRRMCLWQQVI